MQRDPLAALARLRRLETDMARRALAEAEARLLAAEARASAADSALSAEAGEGMPAEYGAWLRRGLAERDRAARSLGFAEGGAAQARAVLAGHRAAERALANLRESRAEAERRAAARRAQALLDEAAILRR
ncbi:hypothetical protein JMJ55_05635 [Belnapia sp. T6]|uniref:Flagellar FliJ protein n=1 Tax=Belnapia mucosa TaxID=2804532 RepID=A0ABS1UZB5_9PROT|nr:hypothetical protein [Belnapia mucosa]MBL6454796.1 hypothetical protein [Belnapia mucosa]